MVNCRLTSDSLPHLPPLLQRRHKRNPHQEKKRRRLKDGEKGKKKGRETPRERETVKKTKGDVKKNHQEKEMA